MNNNRFKAVLFIVLFLLVVAIVVFIITSNSDKRDYTPVSMQTSQPADITPVPEISTPYPTIHITDPTPTPFITPTPIPTPEPTPTPTPEAQPAGTVILTGRFTSDSGTEGMLDIDANYTVSVFDNENVQLTISVDLKHFSLNTIGGPRLHISAGEQFVTIDTPEISYDGGQGQMTTPLGSHTFILSVPAGQTVSVPVQVSWDFGGSYHGVELDSINCGGYVQVVR